MHELSIAMSIVDAVIETLKKERASKVHSYSLEVGSLSGVDIDSLEFALESAVLNTPLDGVPFHIENIRAIGKCRVCQQEFPMDEIFASCPKCSSYNPEIMFGKELKVKSIEIED